MGHHEPCEPHEIFVGNTHRERGSLDHLAAKLRTVRLGDVAYCIEGKRLTPEYAPIFINRSEGDAYNAIMMERTFGQNWRRG